MKKTGLYENLESRSDCRLVREAEVMAFKPLPGRRGERVVQRDRLLTDETGRIDALLKTLDVQQDRLEERLEVPASRGPEDGEPMNTTVACEMDEEVSLRSRIVEMRRRKDGRYAGGKNRRIVKCRSGSCWSWWTRWSGTA